MNRRKIEKIIALAILASMLSITTVSAAEVTKDESVYVNLDSSGKLDKITVSDWLHSTDSNGKFEDESELDDIKNVKSDEKPSQSGKSLSWKVDGSDLYYQGTTDKELPLDVEIKYYLDDKEMKAEDLKGESGKLRIELQIKNKESRNVTINGKDRTIYTPFTTATAITLPNDKFLNVTTSEGTLLSEGNNNIVGFVTFPGLKDSLDLDSMNLDLDVKLDDKLVVEADVENFALAPIMITATPELPDLSDLDYVSTKDELSGALNQLKDASDKLLDGTGQLKDSINLASTKLIDAKKLMNSKSMQEKLSLITSDRNVALANKLLDDADFAKDLDTSEIPGLLYTMNNTLIPLVSPTNINFGKNLLNDANGLQNKYGNLYTSTTSTINNLANDENFLKLMKDLRITKNEMGNLSDETKKGLNSLMLILDEKNLDAAQKILINANETRKDFSEVQNALASAIEQAGGMDKFLEGVHNAITAVKSLDGIDLNSLNLSGLDSASIEKMSGDVKNYASAYMLLNFELLGLSPEQIATKNTELNKKITSLQSAGAINAQEAAQLKALISNNIKSIDGNTYKAIEKNVLDNEKKLASLQGTLKNLQGIMATLPQVVNALNTIKTTAPILNAADKAIANQKTQQDLAKLLNSLNGNGELLDDISDYVGQLKINEVADLVSSLKTLSGDISNRDISNNSNEVAKIENLIKSLPNYPDLASDLSGFKTKLDKANGLIQSVQGTLGSIDTNSISGKVQEVNAMSNELLGMQQDLRDSADILRITKDALSKGNVAQARSLISSLPTLEDGINKLSDGSKQLNNAMQMFHDEGINPLYDKGSIMITTVDDAVALKDELINASKDYDNFAGKKDDMDGKVKFIMKTAEIEEPEKEVEEIKETKDEDKGFFAWLKSLFTGDDE